MNGGGPSHSSVSGWATSTLPFWLAYLSRGTPPEQSSGDPLDLRMRHRLPEGSPK
jgi:hypothetical protein